MGQFRALANKNWILYKRNILGSVLEIVIPTAFMLFIILVRHLAKVVVYENTSNLDNPLMVIPLSGSQVVPAFLKYRFRYIGTAPASKLLHLCPPTIHSCSSLRISSPTALITR